MRVLHFAPYYPPERVGGVGEFVARLHRALVAAGHESMVVTTGIESEESVRRIASGRLGWLLKLPSWAGFASSHDIVHCQSGEALPLLLALALRRKRPRTLATFHVSYVGMSESLRPYVLDGRTFGQGRGSAVQRTLLAWAHRLADALTIRLVDGVNTISRASAQDVLGPESSEKADIVYYGVEPLASVPDSVPDSPELLYVGTGGHRKRVLALPFVLERVRERVPNARLRIVGFNLDDEPMLRSLLAEKRLLDSVSFEGRKTSEEIPPYYASAKALLVPSAYEGLPLVILEAMQCGLPVVATRVSGHPEAIIDGENGFLVPLDEPDMMSDRIVRLLTDDTLQSRLGNAARATIDESFTIDRHLENYLALYRRLLTGDTETETAECPSESASS